MLDRNDTQGSLRALSRRGLPQGQFFFCNFSGWPSGDGAGERFASLRVSFPNSASMWNDGRPWTRGCYTWLVPTFPALGSPLFTSFGLFSSNY